MFRFNINGNLVAVLESQSNIIKVTGIPDGTAMAKLVTSASFAKGTIIDFAFCPNTTFMAVLWIHITEGQMVEIFDIGKQVDRYYLNIKRSLKTPISMPIQEDSSATQRGMFGCFYGKIETMLGNQNTKPVLSISVRKQVKESMSKTESRQSQLASTKTVEKAIKTLIDKSA